MPDLVAYYKIMYCSSARFGQRNVSWHEADVRIGSWYALMIKLCYGYESGRERARLWMPAWGRRRRKCECKRSICFLGWQRCYLLSLLIWCATNRLARFIINIVAVDELQPEYTFWAAVMRMSSDLLWYSAGAATVWVLAVPVRAALGPAWAYVISQLSICGSDILVLRSRLMLSEFDPQSRLIYYII